MPLHADIQVRSRALGLDVLTPILWHKIANGVTEARGNGAGFYGKPYQPGAIVKNDIEYVLFLRKGRNTGKRPRYRRRYPCSQRRKCKGGGDLSGRTFAEPRRATITPLRILSNSRSA